MTSSSTFLEPPSSSHFLEVACPNPNLTTRHGICDPANPSACVKHATHYLDLCGEVNFLARMIPNYDFAASKTGSVLIPMCGFESTPG